MDISQLVLFIISQALRLTVPKNNRFQRWFPGYAQDLKALVSGGCSEKYLIYLTGKTGPPDKTCYYVVDCLLDNIRESIKANIASASVVLGLTPAILTMLGCGTAELALLSMRRPFLSLCLAIGSPTASPVRTFEYDDSFEILLTKASRHQHSRSSRIRRHFVVVAEYLLAGAAIANVATASYDLGVRSISSFSCNQSYHPLLWAFLAAPCQISGGMAFRLRFEMVDLGGNKDKRKCGHFRRWLRNEFSPCSTLARSSIRLKRETALFLVWSGVTAAAITCHILFGTLTFSAILFVAVKDAVVIAARFIASAVLCRAILTYELSGMGETTVIQEDETDGTLLKSRGTTMANWAISSEVSVGNKSSTEFHHIPTTDM